VLVGRPLVLPSDHVHPILIGRFLDVQALHGNCSVDDPVALDDPLLTGVSAPLRHLELVALSFAFEREVVEVGPDESLMVDVPLLVGRVVRLVDPHDDLRPSCRLAPFDVQHLPVHLAHDRKRTSSVHRHGVFDELLFRQSKILSI